MTVFSNSIRAFIMFSCRFIWIWNLMSIIIEFWAYHLETKRLLPMWNTNRLLKLQSSVWSSMTSPSLHAMVAFIQEMCARCNIWREYQTDRFKSISIQFENLLMVTECKQQSERVFVFLVRFCVGQLLFPLNSTVSFQSVFTFQLKIVWRFDVKLLIGNWLKKIVIHFYVRVEVSLLKF